MKTKTFILDNLTHEQTETQLKRVHTRMEEQGYTYESHVVFNSNIPGKFKIVAESVKLEVVNNECN